MRCPKCEVIDLVIADRQGVEIDYCPACRGVWLDRGELDKIIDRIAAGMPSAPAPQEAPREPAREYREPAREYREPARDYREPDPRRDSDRKYDRDDDYYKRKKKRGWFDDIFDFD